MCKILFFSLDNNSVFVVSSIYLHTTQSYLWFQGLKKGSKIVEKMNPCDIVQTWVGEKSLGRTIDLRYI